MRIMLIKKLMLFFWNIPFNYLFQIGVDVAEAWLVFTLDWIQRWLFIYQSKLCVTSIHCVKYEWLTLFCNFIYHRIFVFFLFILTYFFLDFTHQPHQFLLLAILCLIVLILTFLYSLLMFKIIWIFYKFVKNFKIFH